MSVQQGSPFGHGWECDGEFMGFEEEEENDKLGSMKAQLFAILAEDFEEGQRKVEQNSQW